MTLILAIVLAAAGDPTFIEKTADEVLNGSEKAGLVAFVTAVWPDAHPADVVEFECRRRAGTHKGCRIVDERTSSAAQYVADEAAGRALLFVSASGGNATYQYSDGFLELTSEQKVALSSWVSLVWPALTLGPVRGLRVWRANNQVLAVALFESTASPAAYLTKWDSGLVAERLGTVP